MCTNTAPNQKGSHETHRVRPKYIYLGEDADGGTHVYRTSDETIVALDATGHREHRFEIGDARTVEHYVAHVRDARGWDDLRYGMDTYLTRVAEVIDA